MMKLKRLGIVLTCMTIFLWQYTFAAIDLAIQSISMQNGDNTVWQFSTPLITVVVENVGTDDVNNGNNPVAPGFVRCQYGSDEVFSSNPLTSLFIAGNGIRAFANMGLDNETTQTIGAKTVTCTVNPGGVTFAEASSDLGNNTMTLTFTVEQMSQGRFDTALDRSIEPIQTNLDVAQLQIGPTGIFNFIVDKALWIVVPLIIIAGVIIAMLGFYKLMFADGDEEIKTGMNYIIWGTVGIIIMMSANYITNIIFDGVFSGGDLTVFNGATAVQIMYDSIVFPFLKMAIYIVIGIMFVMLLTRVFKFVLSPSDEIKNQSVTIIVWNTVSILIILMAKQLVEFVYGKKDDVLNQNAQNLGEFGGGILTNNLPILYDILNRVLWLAAFIILVLIIIQSYMLLTKPDDEEALTKIKGTIWYAFLGLVVIGTGYVITNFLLFN